VLIGGGTAGAGPFDKPAFKATADELLAAARSVVKADNPVVVLHEAATIEIDDVGRAKERFRLVFVVETQAGVDDWGTVELDWSPFYQNKPVVRARVISSGNQIAELDPKLITDAPTVTDPSTFSDRRKLDAPLPRLAVGVVVEEEFTIEDREPMLAAGTVHDIAVGRSVPVQHTLVTISAPTARPLQLAPRGFAKPPTPTHTSKNGRSTWSYDFGPQPIHEPRPVGTPSETATWTSIGYSTGSSWAAVAADYRKIVEQRIAEGPVALPAEIKPAADRETIDRVVAWLHAHVRYTGIEFSDAAIIPWKPAETVNRGFGDCKDKATLLVALLRSAGVEADLALIDTGPAVDIDRGLAGMGVFDHAIVRARLAGKDLWIDATADTLPAGQLPVRDQARLALIIAPKTTDLVRTPLPAPADNLVREVRVYHVAEHDHSTLVETSTETGVFWDHQRAWIRDGKHDKLTKDFNDYVAAEYVGKLTKFTSSDPNEITRPFSLALEVDNVRRVFTERRKIVAYFAASDLLRHLPALFRDKSDGVEREVKERRLDFVWTEPFVIEIENRLELPSGFTPPQLVAREDKRLGALSFTTQRKVDHDAVVVSYRLETGKLRLTPAELVATRTAVLELQEQRFEHIEIQHTGFALAEQGKVKEALAEIQRLIARHPKEALHYDQLADIYRETGMGPAARRAAHKAIEIEPTSADAYAILGWTLRHDTLGREYGFDADRKGAIEAYRKALAIHPDHLGALGDLATLLTVDEHGDATTDRRDQLEAVKLWRHAKEIAKDDRYDESIVGQLLLAGNLAEAEKAARALPVSERRSMYLLSAIAAQRGPAVALSQADEVSPGLARKQVLAATASKLLLLRRYDDARAVLTAARDGHPDQKQDAVFAKVAIVDPAKLPAGDPRTPALLAFAAMAGLAAPGKPPWDAETANDLEKGQETLRQSSASKPWSSIPHAVANDIIITMQQTTVEGSASEGWRVLLDAGVSKEAFYVISASGRAMLIGTEETPAGVGDLMLKLLAKGDTAAAARWWRRIAGDLEANAKASGHGLALAYKDELTRTSTTEPNKDMLELIGALLVSERTPALAVPILKRCHPTGEALAASCRGALVIDLSKTDDWAGVVEVTRKVPPTDPHVLAAIGEQAYALGVLGHLDEAAKLLDQALVSHPDELLLLRIRVVIAAAGPWADAQPWIEKLAAHPNVLAGDLNNLAWARLFHDATPDKAKSLGARAERMEPKHNATLSNTLAAIEAEADHPSAAWTYLQSSASNKSIKPNNADTYVIGRIAESYGLRDDAIAAYRRVTRSKGRDLAPTAFDFAQRGLARLGVR
jgi:tetratricopeptide (TPR) repeat protein/transglutaminase-like putative cysteine protease